jgi:alkylhydroperoxidase/carboxymuconolactone decarboxylase family protein YurZ
MTAELNRKFDTCNEKALSPKITHLVNLAAHLASNNAKAAHQTFAVAKAVGASDEELHYVACLATCTGGPQVHDTYAEVVLAATGRPLHHSEPAKSSRTSAEVQLADVQRFESAIAAVSQGATDVTVTAFTALNLCTEKSLDEKTTHLVSLAACLATRCACAEGCIVKARNAGASDEEIVRVGCLTACATGLAQKYAFLEAYQAVETVKECVC